MCIRDRGMILMSTQEPPLVLTGILLVVLAFAYWILVVSLCLMVFWFAIFLIVDKKLDPWPAIKLGTEAVLKNFWGVLGVVSVGQLIYLIGVMMCVIPCFLALPIILGGHFIAYWKIFGIESPASETKPVVGSH